MGPVGQAVKTPASHAGNRGSSPLRVTSVLLCKTQMKCKYSLQNRRIIASLHTYNLEVVTMNKAKLNKIAVVVLIILIAGFVVSACDSPDPRITPAYYFSPGGPFQTNITVLDREDNPDPRRQLRCAIVFEVVDEAAIMELEEINFIIRSSVLQVLGKLTMEEITINRDLDAIIQRLVDQINEDIDSHINLIIWGYFTDFAIV